MTYGSLLLFCMKFAGRTSIMPLFCVFLCLDHLSFGFNRRTYHI